MITLNPIKAYRRWRLRKEEREDARLRLIGLSLSTKHGCYTLETLTRAHVYYLYLKYGVSSDGVEVEEIFMRIGDEIKRPFGPIKIDRPVSADPYPRTSR